MASSSRHISIGFQASMPIALRVAQVGRLVAPRLRGEDADVQVAQAKNAVLRALEED